MMMVVVGSCRSLGETLVQWRGRHQQGHRQKHKKLTHDVLSNDTALPLAAVLEIRGRALKRGRRHATA
jgi:hypothetical protein